jgi:hypothetical protein
MRLAPGDQREGQGIVAETQDRQRRNGLHTPGERDAEEWRAHPQQRRREPDSQRDQRQRRDLRYGHADEKVRSTPQQRKQTEKSPFARCHRALCGSRHC